MKMKKPIQYSLLYACLAISSYLWINPLYQSLYTKINVFDAYDTVDATDLNYDLMPYTGVYIPSIDKEGLRVLVDESDQQWLALILSSGIYQFDFYLGNIHKLVMVLDFYSDQFQSIELDQDIIYDSITIRSLTGQNNKLTFLKPIHEISDLQSVDALSWNAMQSAMAGSFYDLNPDRTQIQGISANLVDYNKDEVILNVRNISNLNIELLSLINLKTNEASEIPLKTINLDQFGKDIIIHIPIQHFDFNESYLMTYKYEGIDEILSAHLSHLDNTNTQILSDTGFLNDTYASIADVFSVEGATLILKQTENIIDQAMIIPRGYTLKLTEGQSITFINDAYIRTYSALEFRGTKENPITIRAEGNSQSGIAVIQADQRSIIEYTNFENLTNISQDAYQTTGALNFYESDVDMTNSRISDNRSEDGLNVVRSDFNVSYSTFDSTYSDAFDSDFSTGTLSHSVFINTGNDGFDCSGSDVHIDQIEFTNIGDKALSIGEKTTIEGSNLILDTMDLGIAIKDSSTVTFTNIEFIDIYLSFVQYNKKAVYGVSLTNLTNVSFSGDIGLYYLIQEHEKLIIENEVYIPENLSKSDLIFDALINEGPLR